MSCNTQFVIQFKVKNNQTIAISLKRTAYFPIDKPNFQNSSFNSILSKWVMMMAGACKGHIEIWPGYFTKLKKTRPRTSCSSSSHRVNYFFFLLHFQKKRLIFLWVRVGCYFSKEIFLSNQLVLFPGNLSREVISSWFVRQLHFYSISSSKLVSTIVMAITFWGNTATATVEETETEDAKYQFIPSMLRKKKKNTG